MSWRSSGCSATIVKSIACSPRRTNPSARTEPARNEIGFARFASGGRGLHDLNAGKDVFQCRRQLGERLSVKRFDEENTRGLQHALAQGDGGLGQLQRARLVPVRYAREVRSDIAKHYVGLGISKG